MSEAPPPSLFGRLDYSDKFRTVRGEIIRNRRVFRALERYSLNALDPVAAAGRAELAFLAGTPRHPGVLVSARLERHLNELGREHLPARTTFQRDRSARVDRVLHVMTEAYDTGGHTRIVERWMAADRGRIPTVAITGRGRAQSPPESLQLAARAAGGSVIGLTGEDLLTRAWNLRAVASQHDLVVMHVHGFDVVPALAFAEPEGRPPTILFNHASHEVWIGIGNSDVIASFRTIDELNTRTRRGAPEDASTVLPIPMAPRELPSRQEARSKLGLEPDQQLVIAVASAYKIASVVEPAFIELVRMASQVASRALFLIVGQDPVGPWGDLQRESAGRVRALGMQPGATLDLLLPAADLMLDSWPLSGGTTRLDAGYAGLPIVSLNDGTTELEMVRPGTDALGGAIVNVSDPVSLASTVADLLADLPARAELGSRARAFMHEHHVSGWHARLEAVVDLAAERAGAAVPPVHDPAPEATEWECVILMAKVAGGIDIGPDQFMLSNAANLAREDREPDLQAARVKIQRILSEWSPPRHRAVAEVTLEMEPIFELVSEIYRLVEAEEIDICSVVVPPEQLSSAVPLFEAAMASVPEIDIELIPGTSARAVAGPEDRLLSVLPRSS